MRAAVITDIHANLPALEAVLDDIASREIDEIWSLGDVVGYGAEPDRCAELVRRHCSVSLVGNHDLAVLGMIDISTFTPSASMAVEWTRSTCSQETLDYLRPLLPMAERDGLGLFHASPRDPVWEYVLSPEQAAECFEVQPNRISLIGHSHIALYFHELPPPPNRPQFRTEADGAKAVAGMTVKMDRGRWLVNPGSVGQPRDGDPRAAWLELDTTMMTARYHRVTYDIFAAARGILAASLPHHLASRLHSGR